MSFTSYEFLLFFFLLLLLYYILPKKCQGILLLLGSYLFYVSAGVEYLFYLLAVTAVTYLTARLIGQSLEKQESYLKEHKGELDRDERKAYKKGCGRKRYHMAAIGILVILAILIFAKYTDFLITNINGILSAFSIGAGAKLSLLNLVLPLGISFYTFRAIGYVMDVYWGKVRAEHSVLRIALYLSFFPLIPQGPITSYGELSKTLYKEHFSVLTQSHSGWSACCGAILRSLSSRTAFWPV